MDDDIPLSKKWAGPVCCLGGFVLLAMQVRAYLAVGLLSTWLIGGGLALVLVGAIRWFYYLEDRKALALHTQTEELPTVEEFDRHVDRIDRS